MKASSMTISWPSSCMSEKAAHDAIVDRYAAEGRHSRPARSCATYAGAQRGLRAR